jgi:YHS domain-containing protein
MKTFAVSLIAVLFLSGCASEEPAREMAADPEYTPASSDVAFDPVTGATVRTDSPWKSSWKGTWYYFASEGSLRAFEANPKAYAPEDDLRRPRERRTLTPNEVR